MGRWSHLDSDEERLPSGMKRVAYDADTQTYTYRDKNGGLYESAPGVRYGTMWPARSAPPLPSVHIDENPDGDEKEAPPLPDDAYEFLMLADRYQNFNSYQDEEKRPRSRYKPRSSTITSTSTEASSVPQRRKSTVGGLLQLLRKPTVSSKPRRQGPRIPEELKRRGTV